MPDYPYLLSFSAGGVASFKADTAAGGPDGNLGTADMPALTLGPGCRVEVRTIDLNGNVRAQDVATDLVLTVNDEPVDES